MPGYTEGGGFTFVNLPGGRRLTFPGCPAQYVTPDVVAWIDQYYWYNQTKQTPVQMGLCGIDELDPRWFDAMKLIDGEMARMLAETRPRI